MFDCVIAGVISGAVLFVLIVVLVILLVSYYNHGSRGRRQMSLPIYRHSYMRAVNNDSV